MNKWQKEVLQSQLDDEKQVIEEIKKAYERALRDIDAKIAALKGRTDAENLQSIIYQIEYQKALKSQINAILDEMNAKQFTSISEYLASCYENGYYGTFYDLHGQQIPLIIPIDQEQVVRAVVNNSKISEGLYKRLGSDVSKLKKIINREISRGISSGLSYADISRNLANNARIPMNNAFRIARTEGHRISQEAAYAAQTKAQDAGADIVKQWDATLDRRTRKAHQELDGVIKDIDKPFEYNGHTAMYPGGFGVASLDVNCRCAILQRAKWALDEDELETLKERAQFYGLDKTDNFSEFKKKYLDAIKNEMDVE